MPEQWGAFVSPMIARLKEIGPAKEGFELGPGRTVIDPVKYHAAMIFEAGMGPKSARSRTGVFQEELRLYLVARGEQLPT